MRLMELSAQDIEELTTLRELRDASTTMADDLETARVDVLRLILELADEKRARASAETRTANVPTTSTRSGESLARLKTELAES